jgi:hypothetical protein
VGGVVVDDDNHPVGPGRHFYLLTLSSFLQEFTQPSNFLQAKIVGVRALEKGALAADAEYKFILSMRLDHPQMLDQFDGLTPTKVMRYLAV